MQPEICPKGTVAGNLGHEEKQPADIINKDFEIVPVCQHAKPKFLKKSAQKPLHRRRFFLNSNCSC
ncbi:MAG: hypothetical protein LBN28_01445 [Desulfovibrio sp.]|jgi:hypothetical protein|nr:hypothetical protein [Desulfovibrio sp.]